ncbi:hypothetical protein JCM10599A_10390 [Paraburkholderia kururiensis]
MPPEPKPTSPYAGKAFAPRRLKFAPSEAVKQIPPVAPDGRADAPVKCIGRSALTGGAPGSPGSRRRLWVYTGATVPFSTKVFRCTAVNRVNDAANDGLGRFL